MSLQDSGILPVHSSDVDRLPEHPSFVALDLDGTCLDGHQQLHPDIQRAVSELRSRVPVVIATGRMYRSALPWVRTFGLETPVICYQGAMIRTVETAGQASETLFEQPVAPEMTKKILDYARENDWHRQVFVDDQLYCEEDRPEALIYAGIAAVPINRVPTLDALIAKGSTKITLVFTSGEAARDPRRAVANAFGSEVRVTGSLKQLIEISDLRSSKGQAIARLAALSGWSLASGIAVGDAYNDVDMLDTVGVGVAISTADDGVKRHAAFTCPPPEDGGVAQLIDLVIRRLDALV